MKTAKDILLTASTIVLIMLAIVGTFYYIMDRPLSGSPMVSLSDER